MSSIFLCTTKHRFKFQVGVKSTLGSSCKLFTAANAEPELVPAESLTLLCGNSNGGRAPLQFGVASIG
jgi:hypothetical protein